MIRLALSWLAAKEGRYAGAGLLVVALWLPTLPASCYAHLSRELAAVKATAGQAHSNAGGDSGSVIPCLLAGVPTSGCSAADEQWCAALDKLDR